MFVSRVRGGALLLKVSKSRVRFVPGGVIRTKRGRVRVRNVPLVWVLRHWN